jgi:hypothetical protein
MKPDSIDAFARDWPRQQERWRRLAEWERQQLRRLPDSFTAALAWMSEAWELALKHDPEWGAPAAWQGQAERHAEIRRRLGRAHLTP